MSGKIGKIMISNQIDGEQNTNKSFHDYIYRILRVSDVPVDFFKHLESNYRLILFGGSVRDYIIFKEECKIRDLDFVIFGLKNSTMLEEMIKKNFNAFVCSYNQFGGVKVKTNGITLDCWRLEDTYAFRKKKVKMCVENLLDTPMLNIDRYAYDMSAMQYISGCNMNLLPSEVDFNLYDDDLLEINLVRAIIYSKKYHLKLSAAIKLKLKEVLNDEIRKKKMNDFQMHHYKEEKINLDMMEQEFKLGGYDD